MRLIPALAGKTGPRQPEPAIPAAHPRAGGENITANDWETRVRGSSPRWRGKPRLCVPIGEAVRLIPALAGKTQAGLKQSHATQAHPRAGGENLAAPLTDAQSLWLIPALAGKTIAVESAAAGGGGSSPRWRGKHLPSPVRFLRLRLIPALAGKTIRDVEVERAIAAHPRAGGENPEKSRNRIVFRGSSPRWRGKRSRGAPARRIGLAHPRAGGENETEMISRSIARGSSPRWRGKLRAHIFEGLHDRLIPALAGKTVSEFRDVPKRRAHPRAGGENEVHNAIVCLVPGSSPRWRGKPTASIMSSIRRRLIPALAGKTSP